MVNVPQQYQSELKSAATGAGLPESVAAAQIQVESGFNPQAVSPAGAQGIAQFEPYTWAGERCTGSPFNPADAFKCYSKLMGQLVRHYHGNIRDALAAYNAGEGGESKGIGFDYADEILHLAGKPLNVKGGPGKGGSTPATTTSFLGSIIGGLFGIGNWQDTLERLGLILFGGLLILVGVWLLAGKQTLHVATEVAENTTPEGKAAGAVKNAA